MFSGPFRMHCCNIKEKTLGKYLNLNKHLSQIWATPPDKKSISHVQIDDGSFNKKWILTILDVLPAQKSPMYTCNVGWGILNFT